VIPAPQESPAYQAPSRLTGYSKGHPPPGMSGTGPLLGPPALKRLPPFESGAGLGELAEDDGEVVVVVDVGIAVVVGVVACCASTVDGASHAACAAKPENTIRVTTANHNKTCIRSVISSLR
jgi:hypothetical protein